MEPLDFSVAGSATEQRIAARLRFESPEKFLEFHRKQLGREVVGLRHPEPLPTGTEVFVTVSPPGAPDHIRLFGRVAQVTPRKDGSVKLRVQVELLASDRAWLEAYLQGLRAGLNALPSRPTPPPPPDDAPAEPADTKSVTELAARLPAMTYYQVLGVPRSVGDAELRARFRDLARRYHPDLFYDCTDERLWESIGQLYRRINEAYSVIRDPHRRRIYDQGLQGPPHTWTLRFREEDENNVQRQSRVRRGTTEAGHHYWVHARETLAEARDRDGNIHPALHEARRLLRTARALEPHNEHFQNALEHVSDQLATYGDD